MIGTGMRVSESVKLDAKNIDLIRRMITVVGKGRGEGKERTIPLFTDEVVAALKDQLATGTLWPYTPRAMQFWLTNAGEAAGVPDISPHTLRHTFATRYLKGGGDIFILSRILGHSSPKVTAEIYAHLLTDDLLRASAGIDMGLKMGTKKVLPWTGTTGPSDGPSGKNE
jgi:integrase